MKERPVVLSEPEVRAILAGRKVQFRRPAKLTDTGRVKEPYGHRNWHLEDPDAALASPYGQPCDRLWVRETWATSQDYDHIPLRDAGFYSRDSIWYRAECEDVHPGRGVWRPPSCMPRWASRLTLEITSVRVQRLQDISEEDAQDEGVEPMRITEEDIAEATSDSIEDRLVRALGPGEFPHRFAFELYWQDIYGKRAPWSSNPWVWVVSFRVA